MPTFLEIQNSILSTKAEVDKCLTRCLNAPYPNADRKIRLDKLRDEASAIWGRVAAEINSIDAPARERLGKQQKDLAQKQQEQQEEQRKRDDALTVFRAKQQEHTTKIRKATASSDKAGQAELDKQWQASTQEFESANSEHDRQIAGNQVKINELQADLQKEQQRIDGELARVKASPAPETIIQVERDMQLLLDRVGSLEKEIASGANIELVQKATAVFEDKTADFSDAELHHKSQARKLFWAMIGVIALATAAVYVLFIYLTAATNNIERIVALTTGRVAILVFLGFALKYLADLHRAHSEQAIIYCDRKAALSVANVLLSATPELEQKRAILKTVADIYLNFDNSAFVARRPKTRDPESDVAVQMYPFTGHMVMILRDPM